VRAGPVELHPEAARELEEAVDWYAERSPQAGDALAREVTRALTLIAAEPHLWPSFGAGTRRYLLGRFPYSIVYRIGEGFIEVVAVAHHKRRSGYWRDRSR
jgi:plasmid stabilization system protein ParE